MKIYVTISWISIFSFTGFQSRFYQIHWFCQCRRFRRGNWRRQN